MQYHIKVLIIILKILNGLIEDLYIFFHYK